MKFQEYLDLNLIEYIKELTDADKIPKTLHTYQKTKTGMDGFSGLSIHACPGRSEICSKYCYDAKSIKTLVGGKKVLVKSAFYTYWAMYDPERLKEQLMREIPICTDVIRVHVGGDFINPLHVKIWYEVVRKHKNTVFFAYTRSWRIDSINKELLKLNRLQNFTVFASVDSSTLLPPTNDFRIAQMTKAFDIPKSIECPEQNSKVVSCMKCKICFRKDMKTNLVFKLHGMGMQGKKDIIL